MKNTWGTHPTPPDYHQVDTRITLLLNTRNETLLFSMEALREGTVHDTHLHPEGLRHIPEEITGGMTGGPAVTRIYRNQPSSMLLVW